MTTRSWLADWSQVPQPSLLLHQALGQHMLMLSREPPLPPTLPGEFEIQDIHASLGPACSPGPGAASPSSSISKPSLS